MIARPLRKLALLLSGALHVASELLIRRLAKHKGVIERAGEAPTLWELINAASNLRVLPEGDETNFKRVVERLFISAPTCPALATIVANRYRLLHNPASAVTCFRPPPRRAAALTPVRAANRCGRWDTTTARWPTPRRAPTRRCSYSVWGPLTSR